MEWFNGFTCVCQSPHLCVPLVKEFAELGDAQGGFWSVPAEVKSDKDRAKRHPNEEKGKQNKALREKWENLIKPSGGWPTKEDFKLKIKNSKMTTVSRVHFDPLVVALSTALSPDLKPNGGWPENGFFKIVHPGPRLKKPPTVPKQVAASIGAYTSADQIPGCKNGDYFTVPNYPLDVATVRLRALQAITFNPHSPPPYPYTYP